MEDFNLFYRGGNVNFPLYLYDEHEENKIPNFSEKFRKAVIETLSMESTPENIFSYIYAILHSPTYRTRYGSFLKIDFPKIPVTSNQQLFAKLSELGSKLIALHLVESPDCNDLIARSAGTGDHRINITGKNAFKNNVLMINRDQFFEGITEEIFNFHIGGYQICTKWLRDHKDAILSKDEINHFQKIITIINHTIKLMQQIDSTIDLNNGWPIK